MVYDFIMYKLSIPRWQSFEGISRHLLSWQFPIWNSSCLSRELWQGRFLPLLAQRGLNRQHGWDRAEVFHFWLRADRGCHLLLLILAQSTSAEFSFHITSVGLSAWILPVKLFYKTWGFLHLLLLGLLTFFQVRGSGNVFLNYWSWKLRKVPAGCILYSAFLASPMYWRTEAQIS